MSLSAPAAVNYTAPHTLRLLLVLRNKVAGNPTSLELDLEETVPPGGQHLRLPFRHQGCDVPVARQAAALLASPWSKRAASMRNRS